MSTRNVVVREVINNLLSIVAASEFIIDSIRNLTLSSFSFWANSTTGRTENGELGVSLDQSVLSDESIIESILKANKIFYFHS